MKADQNNKKDTYKMKFINRIIFMETAQICGTKHKSNRINKDM